MRYIVDIKGEIEGDYEIIGKYEERPQGEWTVQSDGTFEYGDYICSNCNKGSKHCFLFCPQCGSENGKVHLIPLERTNNDGT